ncbi:rhodanese-like domain-containing protein [Shimwellia blattae]|uniref:Rhodanese domain-containing protein n=1 Tax=Shimwellia blattae (strain ATCC 29907 / DSM 4481 / JCM 1650 / NBRC 105725 / CDC 9005-74) TaxID=630626 RepID=I2B3S8_SHIBC|nr:rhodanese-like domain-containing protein [Shimwellia blattae]AFJ45182.1 hypothetical protein EBL_c00450 [Shimwellia blattae DSM 4481 = NBRC 105725]GAB80702.1 hypothetical protein EB105725_07_01150 [Shimwellia blattae DSM 4481 = NBRC 105725]VDY62663.1 molybdopterin biosynthesis protein MoeB [Shimwellia blattae]VEC19392.1 molybdopterin biosynthesis protein MoeB [Shimwellia blattae]
MSVSEQYAYYQHKLAWEMDAWDLFTARQAGENIVVVDGRNARAFQQEHIPGAINLPHRQLSAGTTRHLATDALYVCYCDGIGCNGSTHTALKLLALGFCVKELTGGLVWWKQEGYATNGDAGQSGQEMQCGCR